MPATAKKTSAKKTAKKATRPALAVAPAPSRSARRPLKPSAPRMTLAETMQALEQAGSAQTRKTYTRHGVIDPMFGVSFATLKTLHKKIGVDHDLACALWDTGNYDARNLAVKIVDPLKMTPADLDRWAHGSASGVSYTASLPIEGPHAITRATEWLAADSLAARAAGWSLLGQLAQRDETLPDEFFTARLAQIQQRIHTAPNAERYPMNTAVIQIGLRNPALRKAATAAARQIGEVDIDHGDTDCKTPDAAAAIDKAWAHSLARGFASPAAHERTREPPRLRC